MKTLMKDPLRRPPYLLIMFVVVFCVRIYLWLTVDPDALRIDITAIERASTEATIAGGLFAGFMWSLACLLMPLLALSRVTRRFVFGFALFLVAYISGGGAGMLIVGYPVGFTLLVHVTALLFCVGYYRYAVRVWTKREYGEMPND